MLWIKSNIHFTGAREALEGLAALGIDVAKWPKTDTARKVLMLRTICPLARNKAWLHLLSFIIIF